MGLLGRGIAGISAAALLAGGIVLPVQAEDNYITIGRPQAGEYYVLLPAETEEYEVKPGDTLWDIALWMYRDGGLYKELYEVNKEIVKDPSLLYPGQKLNLLMPMYFVRQGGNVEYRDKFCYSDPLGSTMGLLSADGIGASSVLHGQDEYGENYDIACMIREKDSDQDSLKDGEAWEETIRKYVEEQYGDSVRFLTFEQYLSPDGNPVYLYSYYYDIDLSRYEQEGSITLYVCAGVKQTAHMQAEFVGFSTKRNFLCDRVRYMLASFEELLPEGEACTVNENNIVIYPDTEWDAASFNAFAWIDQYFDACLRETTGYHEKQKSNKEKLLDQMREGKGVYGGKKKAGN